MHAVGDARSKLLAGSLAESLGLCVWLPISKPPLLHHPCSPPLPLSRWQTAAATLTPNPPIVRLLGYFQAGQTKQASELLQGEEEEDAIWVVLKWEGLAPLALYPSAQQTSGIGLGRLFGAADSSMTDRARMLRCVLIKTKWMLYCTCVFLCLCLCAFLCVPACTGSQSASLWLAYWVDIAQACVAKHVEYLLIRHPCPSCLPRCFTAGPFHAARFRLWRTATKRGWCMARWALAPSCFPHSMTDRQTASL